MAVRTQRYIAVIADMVKSRALPSSQRRVVQRHFQELTSKLNTAYHDEIVSKFAITLGDEFQGLLRTSLPIPDMIWKMEENFADRELRVGIGLGSLDTPLQAFAINVDGPALHAAREAIEAAKKNDILGGVFKGFGPLDDALTGIARLLWFHRSHWTASQRKIANLLRKGMSQSEVAERLGVKRQVISKQVAAAGWVPYTGAERAWRIILQDYVDPMIGKKP